MHRPRRSSGPRSSADTTTIVAAARITASAYPWAWSTAPVRPSSRSIAIGIVSCPLRDRKLVAPNSPSEIAAARPAATTTGRRRCGTRTSRHARSGDAPSVAAASSRLASTPAEHGEHRAHDERGRDERVADRDEPPRGPPVDRLDVERDEHAEPDRDRRRARSAASSPVSSSRPSRPAAAIATDASVPIDDRERRRHDHRLQRRAERRQRVDPGRQARVAPRHPTEAAPRGQRVAVAEPQRALDEGSQRGRGHDRRDDDGRPHEPALPRRRRALPAARHAEPEGSAVPALHRRRDRHRRRPPRASCNTVSVAAAPMSPNWVACRQISTSIVDRLTPPSRRTTPNDVNVNTKTIAADAHSAGVIAGSVISRNTRRGDAPSVAAACLEVAGDRREHGPDGAHDDREVEHDVGGEDRDHAAVERVGEQRQDRRPDDDRRQHEHRREQPVEQPPPSETGSAPSRYAGSSPTTTVSAVDAPPARA